MANCLVYSLSGDFNGNINIPKLSCAINSTALSVGFQGIGVDGDDVNICFDGIPSGSDTTIVNGLVSTHDPSINVDYGDITINVGATGDPGINNDISSTFEPGSLWINQTDDKVWVNVDNTDGAAVWSCLSCDAKTTIGSTGGLVMDGQMGGFLDLPDPNDGDEWIDPFTGDRYVYNATTNTWNQAPCCGSINILGSTGGMVFDGLTGAIPDRPFPKLGDEWVDPQNADRFIYNGTIWQLAPYPDIEQLANVEGETAIPGTLIVYQNGQWETISLCNALEEYTTVDCLGNVNAPTGPTGASFVFTGGPTGQWIPAQPIYEFVNGEWVLASRIIGEMFFNGDTLNAGTLGNNFISSTLSTEFQAIRGLTGGYRNAWTFTNNGPPGFAPVGETGDFLTCESNGVYLATYTITVVTSNNADLILDYFINGQVENKAASRSLTSGNKFALLSSQVFLELFVGDVVDFRLRLDPTPNNVGIEVYHCNLTFSRISTSDGDRSTTDM